MHGLLLAAFALLEIRVHGKARPFVRRRSPVALSHVFTALRSGSAHPLHDTLHLRFTALAINIANLISTPHAQDEMSTMSPGDKAARLTR